MCVGGLSVCVVGVLGVVLTEGRGVVCLVDPV